MNETGTNERIGGVSFPRRVRKEIKIRLSGKALTEARTHAQQLGFTDVGTAYWRFCACELKALSLVREAQIEEAAEIIRRYRISRDDLARKGVLI